MMKQRTLSRPATSAIAAFLAVTTPAAFAQEAPTVPMTPPVAVPPAAPPTVAEPAPVAPTAAPQTATSPTPVIRVPLDVAPEPAAPAQPEPRAAERQVAPASVRTERPAPRARAAVAAPAATTVEAAAPVASEALPVEAPIAVPTGPVIEPAPAPVEKASVSGDAFPWEIAGGAAALLLVGGAGLAFARRRRSEHAVEDEGMTFEQMAAAEAVPYHPPARKEVAVPAPVARDTPSFAAAPHGSMGRHEAMALAGPTPDNPFATLKKRLQRARFLDRQERAAYEETLAPQTVPARKPASAWEIAQREVAPAPAEQEVRRPERGPARSGTLRPGFARH